MGRVTAMCFSISNWNDTSATITLKDLVSRRYDAIYQISHRDDYEVINLNTDSHIEEAIEYLSEEELYVAARIYKTIDKKNYILSHAVLRILLSLKTSTRPNEIKFVKGSRGKPSINEEHCNINFNISHSHECFVIVLSDLFVGVDVEQVNKNVDYIAIARLCYTEEEQEYVNKGPIKDKINRFYWLWTRKEASIKAIGESLDIMPLLNAMSDIILINDTRWKDWKIFIRNTCTIDNYICAVSIAKHAKNTSAGLY